MKLIICKTCGQQSTKTVGRYNESIKNRWNLFCSINCRYAYNEKGKEFSCAWCSKKVRRTPAQLRKIKVNVFCDKSCAAFFNNRNKFSGFRRSKLEKFLEEEITHNFPQLNVVYNSNKTIGLELDVYFPSLKLAIEFNGHLHYHPIYGQEKLNRIQLLDKVKVEKCKKLGIKLYVIDVSRETHLTNNLKVKHWEKVKELVISTMKCADYTTVQVSFL